MIPAVIGAVLLTACQPVEPEALSDEGSLSISVSQSNQTKALTTSFSHENQLNKMRVLVYDSDGNLYKDESLASPFNAATIPNVKTGAYSVMALANTCAALSDARTVTSLSGTAVTLDDCSTTASTGFVMLDNRTGVNVSAGPNATSVNLSVTRFPARVRLVSVKNALPSSLGILMVKSVMLINGYSSWTLGTTGNPTGSVNPAGRKNGTGAIIGTADDADYPNHSFRAVPTSEQSIASGTDPRSYSYCFYSFPNRVNADVTGAKQVGGKARLVVCASFNNMTYYYPVTIETLERNTCYDVALIISGAGSPDPNVPVEKGAMSVSITVKDWENGADYSETI